MYECSKLIHCIKKLLRGCVIFIAKMAWWNNSWMLWNYVYVISEDVTLPLKLVLLGSCEWCSRFKNKRYFDNPKLATLTSDVVAFSLVERIYKDLTKFVKVKFCLLLTNFCQKLIKSFQVFFSSFHAPIKKLIAISIF